MSLFSFALYCQRRITDGAGGNCDPYERQNNLAMDVDLDKPVAYLPNTAVDVNLCEEMT